MKKAAGEWLYHLVTVPTANTVSDGSMNTKGFPLVQYKDKEEYHFCSLLFLVNLNSYYSHVNVDKFKELVSEE